MSGKTFRVLRRYAVAPIVTLGLAISLLVVQSGVAASATAEAIATDGNYFPSLLIMRSGDKLRICNKDSINHKPLYYKGGLPVRLGLVRPGRCVTTAPIRLRRGVGRGTFKLSSEIMSHTAMDVVVYRGPPGRQTECRIYALTAVAQQDMNVARSPRQHVSYSCRITGRRWSTNYNGHYNWCMRASVRARRAETQARYAALLRCSARWRTRTVSSVYPYKATQYYPGNPKAAQRYRKVSNATRKPDWDKEDGGTGVLSLGCGGKITLHFNPPGGFYTDKVIVHEIGSAAENSRVDIYASGRLILSRDVGGGISPIVFTQAQPVTKVILTDLKSSCDGPTAGADIDTVELVGRIR